MTNAERALLSEETVVDETPRRPGFRYFADLAAEVDAAGPRKYLVRGVWPAADHGVLAAEMKAQKTWTAVDLAVSVATGTPFLGRFPIDDPGTVLLVAGEGSAANIVRRIRATAEARGIEGDDLNLAVLVGAPQIASPEHREYFQRNIDSARPKLLILDPLYAMASGLDGKDLYAMGAAFGPLQRTCTTAGCALLLVTHTNRSRTAEGAGRITGAGPAEWGRVLLVANVKARHTDPATRATRVLTEYQLMGGEVPDLTFRVTRRITADDPDNLDSPLHIDVSVEDADDQVDDDGPSSDRRSPAEAKLVEALTQAAGQPRTSAELVDAVAETHGHGLKRETVSRALNRLTEQGVVDSLEDTSTSAGRFPVKRWFLR